MIERIVLVSALSLSLVAGAFAARVHARSSVPLPESRPVIVDGKRVLNEKTDPAKKLFAAKKLPSVGKSKAIGYYPRGCLAGGVELPVDGPTWQVMRVKRNRNWGHPELVKFLERFRAACRQGNRLARHSGRRHGATTRRPAALRPYQPSGRARRRHLADADARSPIDRPAAQRHAAALPGRARPQARRSENLDVGLSRFRPHRGRAARGRAHFHQCGDQEGTVPRSKASIITPGCRRCGPGTGTTTTSMCG